MPIHPDKYRQEMYRLRAHPNNLDRQLDREQYWRRIEADRRDSFSTVYTSIIPFLGMEFLAELMVQVMPSGVVFPLGWLLFWAYYYTYYRPDFLERTLTESPKEGFTAIPVLVLGLTIWFLKVTIMECFKLVHRPKARKPIYQNPTPQKVEKTPPPKKPSLPLEVQEALLILGLREVRDWKLIQHRYRTLAKQYHPDLHPNRKDYCDKFIQIETAYRRLSHHKHLF